jgi:hypothetical protein
VQPVLIEVIGPLPKRNSHVLNVADTLSSARHNAPHVDILSNAQGIALRVKPLGRGSGRAHLAIDADRFGQIRGCDRTATSGSTHRVLIVVPSRELRDQLAQAFREEGVLRSVGDVSGSLHPIKKRAPMRRGAFPEGCSLKFRRIVGMPPARVCDYRWLLRKGAKCDLPKQSVVSLGSPSSN